MKALDTQVGGSHYKDMAIQPIEFTLANGFGGCEHSILKYATRWQAKNGLQDVQKAEHLLQILMEYQHKPINCDEYINANGIPNPAAGVIRHLWFWQRTGRRSELDSAMKWMGELLEAAAQQ